MKSWKFEDLQLLFTETQPQMLADESSSLACVAVLLNLTERNHLEIAYIRRSENQSGNWSGQIAFPGGYRESFDPTPLHAALREVQEELGFDLDPGACIGRLDDIQARRGGELLPFFIRPFVFFLARKPEETSLNPTEVSSFFWFPVEDLLEKERQISYTFERGQMKVTLPAIQMESDPPLWGLTYFMTLNLLKILGLQRA